MAVAIVLALTATMASSTEFVECLVGDRPVLRVESEAPFKCRRISAEDFPVAQDGAPTDSLERRLRDLETRVRRLENRVLTPPPRITSPQPRTVTPTDPFDTRGRLRDLGDRIDRRLDELGR